MTRPAKSLTFVCDNLDNIFNLKKGIWNSKINSFTENLEIF